MCLKALKGVVQGKNVGVSSDLNQINQFSDIQEEFNISMKAALDTGSWEGLENILVGNAPRVPSLGYGPVSV